MPSFSKQPSRRACARLLAQDNVHELMMQEEKATCKYLRRKDHYPNDESTLIYLFMVCTVYHAALNWKGISERIRIPGRSELPLINNRT